MRAMKVQNADNTLDRLHQVAAYLSVRFEVFTTLTIKNTVVTALTMKDTVFWDVMPCDCCNNRVAAASYC
jgi:hypothetical protein